MSTIIIQHDDCLRHDPGPKHPESVQRIKAVKLALEDLRRAQKLPAPLATTEQITRVHPAEFWAGLKAEEEGYDAVCIDTVSDSGMYSLRSRLSIPVIGPGQAAIHAACMLGHKFSFITMWDEWFHLYRKILTEYKVESRCASLRSIKTRPDLEELLAGKEEVIFKKLEEESLKAIEEDGADVIVLGSTTMHQSHGYLKDVLPVPVVNPGQIAYKLCEVFLELGLTHSNTAFPAPEMPNDAGILSRGQ